MTAPLDTSIEVGSGNVFRDIGIRNPEVALVKAELVSQINSIINRRKMSQKEAAYVLGVQPQNISRLSRGRLTGFSLERLLEFTRRLGYAVQIKVMPSETPTVTVAREDRT